MTVEERLANLAELLGFSPDDVRHVLDCARSKMPDADDDALVAAITIQLRREQVLRTAEEVRFGR